MHIFVRLNPDKPEKTKNIQFSRRSQKASMAKSADQKEKFKTKTTY